MEQILKHQKKFARLHPITIIWSVAAQAANSHDIRQAINCTGTDNQKQSNTTLHTPETQKRNRKKPLLANNTNYALVWYASYDLRP